MAYDDIRISELPSLPELHVNDLFLIQDVTNGLAHNIDWNRLKNSIGVLANGITFPLGTPEEPQIALGDYTSGIYGDDFGTFNIVTHAVKRIGVNQAGTIELVNGNVLVGNYDRQCDYTFVVNNLTRFNCFVSVQGDLEVGGDLDVVGDITGGKDLSIPGSAIFGRDCQDDFIVQAQLQARCDLDVRGTTNIHTDLFVDKNGVILKDMTIGSSCRDKLDIFSTTHMRCDLRVDGDLSFGGDLLLEGSDIGIGAGCNSTIINLKGTTIVYCDLRVNGITYLDSDLFHQGNQFTQGNLLVSGDTTFGENCTNHTTIKGGLTAECDSLFQGDVTIGSTTGCPGTKLDLKGELDVQCDILGEQDLKINHNVELGTGCGDDLLVHSKPVFECDTLIDAGLTVKDDILVEGDLTSNGNVISLGDPNIGCQNRPNQIDLHGVVNVECDLNVAGDIKFDGNLGFGGAVIALGEGCNTTDIFLNGIVINKCDTTIEGNLFELGSSIFEKQVRINDTLNVLKKTSLTDDLLVNQFVRLNRPVTGAIDGGPPGTSQDYWYHCCDIPSTETCALDDPLSNITEIPVTEVFGRMATFCNVELNDPRWHPKCNDGTSHVQITDIYGHLNARSNVDLNSAEPHSAVVHHKQQTRVWGQLQQHSIVELNKAIDPASGSACGFDTQIHTTQSIDFNTINNPRNRRQTTIHGDLLSEKSVLLNSNATQMTQVMGQFQTQQNVYLNGDFTPGVPANDNNCGKLTKIQGVQESFCKVYLNGQQATYTSNTYKDCSKETIVWGTLYASCDQEFGNASNVCQHTTTLHTNLMQDGKVELNRSSTGTGCCAPSTRTFNDPNNNRCSIIHGDLDVKASTILNRNGSDATRINGVLDSRTHGRINGNVNLNGAADGTTKTCGNTTDIWGTLNSHCNVNLNDSCSELTTIKGKLLSNCDVTLNSGSKQCGLTTEINGTLNSHCNVNLNDGCGETTTINGQLHSKCDVQIDGNTIMNGTLLVKGNITGNSDLLIKGDTVLEGTLLVKKDITGNANLTIKGNITGEKDLTIWGNTTLGKGCSNTTTVNSDLIAKCAVDIDGDLTGKGDSSFGSGCPTSKVVMNATTQLKATEIAGTLKAANGYGGASNGTTEPDEWMALTSGSIAAACGTAPKWNKIVNSIKIPAGGALKSTGDKKTGKLELDVSVCDDGGLEVDSTCGLKLSPTACPDWKKINLMAQRLYTWESGGTDFPGIMLGARNAIAGKVWVGISANQNNGSFQTTSGTGGVSDAGNCGPNMGSTGDKILSVAQGYEVLPHHGTAGLVQSGNKKNGVVVAFEYGGDGSTVINPGPPKPRTYNRLAFDIENFVIGEGTKPPTGGGGGGGDGDKFLDSRLADFDIDQQLEAFGGGFEQDENALRSGDTPSVRWTMKEVDGLDESGLSYPFAYMDTDELATKMPLFVNYTYKNSAFEAVANYDDDGTFNTWDHKLRTDLTADDIEPGRLNYVGLHGFELAALVKHKRKLDDIYKNVELLESAKVSAPITFNDIVKIDLNSLHEAENDESACSCGVEVGQVYRNGSQLMVRVS